MEEILLPIRWVLPLIILILPLILHFLTSIHSNKTQPKKLPPGPPKLPLVGNLHQMVVSNSGHPHRRLAELAREYGPIMHLQLGEVPTVIVSSADVAREVMKTHDVACCSRPELMTGKEFFYDSTDIGLAPYGEYWRQVRKIATLELFTSKRVQSFRAIREEEVANFIEFIRSQVGSVINLSELLFGLTFNITARVAFGKKDKGQESFRALAKEVTKVTSGFAMADLYPSSKLLYLVSGMRKKLQECIKEANKLLDPIIEEHKLNKKSSNQVHDLVDVLLKFHTDNVQDTDFSLTTDNIKAVILELFGGGSDTSSTTLEWAISELIKNPRAMRKVQDEVRRTYQVNGALDESNLDKLNYLKLVIKETLRLHPPIPLLVPRETIEECRIQGYDIPLKTRVIVNAWTIARDPKYWSEPEKFIPERFEDSSIDFKGTHFELIPFGAGRRKCPGMPLGIANVELPLAMLLCHFDWKLPNKQFDELDMDESFGITMRRKNELFVIPTPCS